MLAWKVPNLKKNLKIYVFLEPITLYKDFSPDDILNSINANKNFVLNLKVAKPDISQIIAESLGNHTTPDKTYRDRQAICNSVTQRISEIYYNGTWLCQMGNIREAFHRFFYDEGHLMFRLDLDANESMDIVYIECPKCIKQDN